MTNELTTLQKAFIIEVSHQALLVMRKHKELHNEQINGIDEIAYCYLAAKSAIETMPGFETYDHFDVMMNVYNCLLQNGTEREDKPRLCS